MNVRLAFLTAPLEVAFDRPDWLRSEPEASGVVSAFGGERSLTYIPTWLDEGASDGWAHLYNIDSGGATVGLFERTEAPPQLYAVWRLRSGQLKTFLNEPTVSTKALESVVAAITVTDGDPLPRVQLDAPLERVTRSGAEYEDRLTFFRAEGSDGPEVVVFTHHPGVRVGATAVSELDDRAYVSRMVKPGVRLTCEGPIGSEVRLQDAVDELAATVE